MVWVFSFCLFGSEVKYSQGMLENLGLIQEHFPQFETWIYLGSGVLEPYLNLIRQFPRVKLISVDLPDSELTCARFFPIDSPEVEGMLSRDADSRICPRDRWAIQAFLDSDLKAHSIRDHFWHKLPFNAGMWGLKQGAVQVPIQQQYQLWRKTGQGVGQYEGDQHFLKVIYAQVKETLLIHTSSVAFSGETYQTLPKLESDTGFIGQVYHYPEGNQQPKFSYSQVDLPGHLNWLKGQNQIDLAFIYVQDLQLSQISPEVRRQIGLTLLDLAQTLEQGLIAMEWFEYCLVDETLFKEIAKIWKLYRVQGWKVIGSTDLSYQPKEKEVVVYYGNYPHDYRGVPRAHKVYRHPFYYQQLKHDQWIYAPCWNNISVIYVTNLRNREDRWMEILSELARMGAPLQKIYHYLCDKETVTGNKEVDIYLGASKNHLECAEHFEANCEIGDYALILEDDFTFTPDIAENQKTLAAVLEGDYQPDVCLISASKHHDFQPYDQLLNLSFQVCTTTSGYLLYSETVDRIVKVFREGYQLLLQTGEHWNYCCDRYWAKLQKDRKFFVLKNKLGYQRPNFSSIMNQNQCHFD